MVCSQDLKQIHLFEQLSDNVLHQFEQAAIPLQYGDGQVICLDDDDQGAVFFVINGVVRAYRSSLGGREQNLIHLKTGDAFNIPAAFTQQSHVPVSAMCIGPVKMIKIPFADFRAIVSRNPQAALAVLNDLSNKLVHLTQLTHDLSLRSVRARLARFLLDQSLAKTPAGVHWTQQEIAAQIGSVREVVSRILRSFVREGLIRMERQRIILLDTDLLETEANQD